MKAAARRSGEFGLLSLKAMAPITSITEVARPAEKAFAYVIHPSTMPEWLQGVVRGHMDGATTRIGSKCTTV
jgi:hypothetical protein